MRVLLVGLALGTGYLYALLHTTDVVMRQVDHIGAQYQYISEHADQIARSR